MRNKRSILNIFICVLTVLILTCTGCSATKSDEERWNDTKNVIEAESVKDDTDYSKFDEETKSDNKDDKSDTDSTTLDKSAKESVNKKSDSTHTDSKQEEGISTNESEKVPEKQTCTISISCSTILSNMDKLKDGKEGLVPSNGVILGSTTVEINEGESVFDVLKKVTRNSGIHMEYVNTPGYDSAYIEGIANLYENDCGNGSGWMYSVNGWYPDYGCSQYDVQNGDVIRWSYTCDLGNDL